ncbi:putative transporter [Legionella geestiana]|uniref:Putative transporter n=1 Tax=Legionella geestiana TaxID=45065 RepID=A0A0W0UA51_9GAMM|nr:CAP domain-containing protein [Legionella geestiana]KTD04835.1 putative transporter [Legionella geestiana]STX54014.1 putative transporter [Legionella geestiana]
MNLEAVNTLPGGGSMRALVVGFLVTLFSFTALAADNREANMAQDVLREVNAWRAAHHLQLLVMDESMSREALAHSREMANHKVPFGHTGFGQRIARIYKTAKMPMGGSENVAYNYKDARDVVRNWLTSPGHRRNIAGNFNKTGVGIVRDSRGKLYFTQIFLRDAPVKRRHFG